ncbi:MAG TPA: response regulator transcription factor [Thermoanaerobaculia bacterium]|nr:response regulator transcription factor [Thermoanaerobaculia bacterium]
MTKPVVLWAAAGGVLIAVLKVVEYKHFVHEYPADIYGALVALIFTAVGVYVGLKWMRSRPPAERFVLKESNLRDVGLTPREHEILGLIAEGLSNREIGDRLFVSENTVKTHASRLFEKMQVRRRVQAVRKGKELGLIP